MKYNKSLFNRRALAGMILMAGISAHAENKLDYSYSLIGSGTTGDYIPFYSISNKNGAITPLNSGGYLRGAAEYTLSRGNLGMKVGGDVIVTTISSNYYDNNAYLQQLYADFSFCDFSLSFGQKENYQFFVNDELSSGNVLFSNNARPYPKIQLRTNGFVAVPFTNHWLNVNMDISYGKTMDTRYTRHLADIYQSQQYSYGFKDGQYIFIENPYLHRKSLFISSKPTAPLVLTVGLEHTAYFGGSPYSRNKQDTKSYNSGLQNMLDVLVNKKWDETGNYNLQYAYSAALDFKIEANFSKAKLSLYTQNYLDYNQIKGFLSTDNLWGIEFNNKNRNSIVRDCVIEYLIFTNQGYSAFHGTYYQDIPYGSWSHYGMSFGTPFCVSPIYNPDGNPSFTNTLVRAGHIGVSGQISSHLEYQLKAMYLKSWGANFRYLPNPQENLSINLALDYQIFNGWHISPSLGLDNGKIFGNNFGGTLTIKKVGEIKF